MSNFFMSLLFEYRNLILTTVVLGIVWLGLRKEAAKLKFIVAELSNKIGELQTEVSFKQTQLSDKIGELQEDVGAVQENTADATQEEKWNTVKEAWNTTKAKIQREIKSISHKSTREKYKKFKKYTYEDIINQLKIDGKIDLKTQIKLLKMDDLFRNFRRQPKNIDTEKLQEFQEIHNEVMQVLGQNKS